MTLPVQETESKVAFTPGPWTLNPHCQRLVNGGANRREVAKTSFGPDGDKAENTANAALISAAPEMYEALKAALRILERDFPSGQLVIDARAALLKAQGNQP
jgi:hypothetical protein